MKKSILFLIILTITVSLSYPQGKENPYMPGLESQYSFTPVIDLRATPVKDQSRTNTCWSFSTTSFFESELIRMGKGEYDLSEMYLIRNNYSDRLENYFLNHDNVSTLGEGGGLPHDWVREFRKNGIVPDEAYSGLTNGSQAHNHEELHSFLSAVASVPVTRNRESPQYHEIVNSILDIYLGKIPETFKYRGNRYTPASFTESLDLNPDDYVEISSFTHIPFYSQGVLEVPDNWAMAKIYNVPLDDLIRTMVYSLENGFTFAWDGDVSEAGFQNSKGLAVVPEEVVTQEMRQEAFLSKATTDDHGMHVTGLATSQDGSKFFKVKNSWGPGSNLNGGYLYMSEPYVRSKTILILINKNALPVDIRTKLGL